MTQRGATKSLRRDRVGGVVGTGPCPVTQWIGASKCVPVCSPQVKLFQYHPAALVIARDLSSRNGLDGANCGGRIRVGKSGDRVCVRSTTRTRWLAMSSARSARLLMTGS